MKRKISQSVALGVMLAGLIGGGCAGHRPVTSKNAIVEESRTEHRRVHFIFNKYAVRDEDKSVLNEVASKLQGDKKTMAILEGHADQIGGSQYNEVLSENRARAVRVYLRDQGVDPRRMTITSKGAREPVVTGRTPAELQENRRVEVILTLTRGDQ